MKSGFLPKSMPRLPQGRLPQDRLPQGRLPQGRLPQHHNNCICP